MTDEDTTDEDMTDETYYMSDEAMNLDDSTEAEDT